MCRRRCAICASSTSSIALSRCCASSRDYMRFISTRGRAPELDFAGALLEGLARDGGLYVPDALPKLPGELPSSYVDVAAIVTGLDHDVLREAYATFDHRDVCPVVQLDDHLWLQELWHAPTLA